MQQYIGGDKPILGIISLVDVVMMIGIHGRHGRQGDTTGSMRLTTPHHLLGKSVRTCRPQDLLYIPAKIKGER